MFELPEITVLARQMNEALRGKTIRRVVLGNSPHKNVWYNRSRAEFSDLTAGKTIGEASSPDLYDNMHTTVQREIDQGGHHNEYDLYGRPGGYRRLMDKNATGNQCMRCGEIVRKILYWAGRVISVLAARKNKFRIRSSFGK